MINYPVIFIRLGIGLLMFFFGLHQFFKPMPWAEEYIPARIRNLFGGFLGTVMRTHALINLLLGAALLSGWQLNLAAGASWLWLLSILPFAFHRSWKTGLRDLAINFSLLALLFLLK